MPAASRLGDKAQVSSDAHGCPACPHPGTGPLIVGSSDVTIDGLPAARRDDLGMHAACCGPNIFKVKEGSATVYVNGKPLARLGDGTTHCGGDGSIIDGSSDVFADDGGGAAGALGALASRALAIALEAAAAFAAGTAQQHSDTHEGGGGGGGGGASGGSGAGAGGRGGPGGDLASDGAPGTPAGQGTGAAGDQPGSGTGAGTAGTAPQQQLDAIDLLFVSAAGTPQADLEYEVTLPGGTKRAGKSDASGAAQIKDLTEKGKAKLELPDVTRAKPAPAGAPDRVRFVEGGVDVEIGKRTTVEVPPRVRLGRLTGMHFETAKTFLLPSAMVGIKQLVKLYKSYSGLKALVNGHTDKQGGIDYNRGLSKERADAIKAFLIDDVDGWIKWYQGMPCSDRWGVREDQYMLSTIKDGAGAPFYSGPINGALDASTRAAIKRFQHAALITETGSPTQETRHDLISRYMALEGTTLPPGAQPETHGCGLTHPLPETQGDPNPDQPKNRRVEVFLFEGAVAPAPQKLCPWAGCSEHQQWVDHSILIVDLDAPPTTVEVRVTDQAGAVLGGADVHLAGPIPQDGKTDAGGAVKFTELVPGDYKAIAEKDGFDAADDTKNAPPGGTAQFVLALQADLFDLVVKVEDQATPPNALAAAKVEIDLAGFGPLTTDGNGLAKFSKLPRGKRHLTATHQGFEKGEADALVGPAPSASSSSSIADAAGAAPKAGLPTIALAQVARLAFVSSEDHFAPGVEAAVFRYDIAGLEKRRVRLRVTSALAAAAKIDPVFERDLDAGERAAGQNKSIIWNGQTLATGPLKGVLAGPELSPYRVELIADAGPSDAREVKILIKEVALTASDVGGKWFMNFTGDVFPKFEITARVQLLRTNGQGADPHGPLALRLGFSEPAGQNATRDNSFRFTSASGAKVPLGKSGDPAAVFWEELAGFKIQGGDPKTSVIVETAAFPSKDAGRAKVNFLPGGCGGDTYTLAAAVRGAPGSTDLASAKAGPLEVWRKLEFTGFEMANVGHVSSHASTAQLQKLITPANTFVEATVGAVKKLDAKFNATYVSLWKGGAEVPWSTAQKKQGTAETPDPADVTLAAGNPNDADVKAARARIRACAMAWRDRLISQVNDGHIEWLKDTGLFNSNSLVGGNFLHPKISANLDQAHKKDPVTAEWSAFPWLRVDDPHGGADPNGGKLQVDPDASWGNDVEGREFDEKVAFVPKGAAGDNRINVVIAHECCHESQLQFHRRLFGEGTDDHDRTLGLMDKQGAGSSLIQGLGANQFEALVLRGYDPTGGVASLDVSVADEGGRAIPAALVRIALDAFKDEKRTDGLGKVHFSDLKTSTYHLHVERSGFAPHDADVQVQVKLPTPFEPQTRSAQALVPRQGQPALPATNTTAVVLAADVSVTMPAPTWIPNPPVRRVGAIANPTATDNLREDVLGTMERLDALSSYTTRDFNTDHAAVEGLPLGSQVPAGTTPSMSRAIAWNEMEFLSVAEADRFLALRLSGSVSFFGGKRDDLQAVQVRLRALGAHSLDAEIAAASAEPTNRWIDGHSVPLTVAALQRLRQLLAAGEVHWSPPAHADETALGADKLGGQTFHVPITVFTDRPSQSPRVARRTVTASVFVPRLLTAPAQGDLIDDNSVAVFYSPGDATSNHGLNAVNLHGVRGAADPSRFIVISVPGIRENNKDGFVTVDDAAVRACLDAVGRAKPVKLIRLIAHSRGCSGLKATLDRKLLKGSLEAVFVVDESTTFGSDLKPTIDNAAPDLTRAANFQAFHYRVNAIHLRNTTEFDFTASKAAMRAIGYSRLILDAATTRRDLAVPGNISTQVLPLPARGMLTTNSPPPAGRTGLAAFIAANAAGITTIETNVHAANADSLKAFVDTQELHRFGRSFPDFIDSHHLFVPEIAHEFFEDLPTPPQPKPNQGAKVRLTDAGWNPMGGAAARVFLDEGGLSAQADPQGWLAIGDDLDHEKVRIEWGGKTDTDPQPFVRELWLKLGEGDTAIERRLSNLGWTQANIEERVRAFQADFAIPIDGQLSSIQDQVIAWHDGGARPGGGGALAAQARESLVEARGANENPGTSGGPSITAGPNAQVVLAPRILYSINLSRGARRDFPPKPADADEAKALQAMVDYIKGRASSADADLDKLMADADYEYTAPGIDPSSSDEKWARLVAKLMTGMPYILTETAFGNDWIARFQNTGHYPLSVLCQQSSALQLMLGGWQGFSAGDFGIDGSVGSWSKMKNHVTAQKAAGKSGYQFSENPLAVAAMPPGTVLVWATPKETFDNNIPRVVQGNAGHDAVLLRRPPSNATLPGGHQAAKSFQPFDVGMMINRSATAYERPYPPKSGVNTPPPTNYYSVGGANEETWLDFIRAPIDFGHQNIPRFDPPHDNISVKCDADFMGAAFFAPGLAPTTRDLRPRGMARLKITRRADNKTLYRSSWISLTLHKLSYSHLAWSVRGVPGADKYEARWQVDVERSRPARDLCDVFAEETGCAIVDTKSNKAVHARFEKGKLGFTTDSSISTETGQALDASFTSLWPLSKNPCFDGPVAMGKLARWIPGARLVPLFNPKAGGAQEAAVRMLAYGPGTSDTLCRVYGVKPDSIQPIDSLVTDSTFAGIKPEHTLLYCGSHAGKENVFQWFGIDRDPPGDPNASVGMYWVWPFARGASGTAQPLPGPEITKGNWRSIGKGTRFLYLPDPQPRMMTWTPDGEVSVWTYDPASADLLPKRGAWGKWQELRPEAMVYLGGNRILEWYPAGSYRVWTYDSGQFDLNNPGSKDPLGARIGGGDLDDFSGPRELVYLGGNRLLTYDAAGNYSVYVYLRD